MKSTMNMRYVIFPLIVLGLLVLLTCIPEKDDGIDIPKFEPITVEYFPGDTVHLIAEPNPGWKFSYWSSNGNTVGINSDYVFIMPSYDIDVVAVFVKED
jgi:hypothetical protein